MSEHLGGKDETGRDRKSWDIKFLRNTLLPLKTGLSILTVLDAVNLLLVRIIGHHIFMNSLE